MGWGAIAKKSCCRAIVEGKAGSHTDVSSQWGVCDWQAVCVLSSGVSVVSYCSSGSTIANPLPTLFSSVMVFISSSFYGRLKGEHLCVPSPNIPIAFPQMKQFPMILLWGSPLPPPFWASWFHECNPFPHLTTVVFSQEQWLEGMWFPFGKYFKPLSISVGLSDEGHWKSPGSSWRREFAGDGANTKREIRKLGPGQGWV